MFSHVMVGANDIEKSKKFYDKTMEILGGEPGVLSPNLTGQKRYFYFLNDSVFCISEPIDGNSATYGNGSTIGFSVKDTETGDAWHAAGIEHGGTTCEEPPGTREGGGFTTYLAYLRDPSGNKLCALLRL